MKSSKTGTIRRYRNAAVCVVFVVTLIGGSMAGVYERELLMSFEPVPKLLTGFVIISFIVSGAILTWALSSLIVTDVNASVRDDDDTDV